MKSWQILLIMIIGLSNQAIAQQAAPPPPAVAPKAIELETLRIKGYIYEPQVLLILERPNIELITIEEKKRHDFLENFDQPLLEMLY